MLGFMGKPGCAGWNRLRVPAVRRGVNATSLATLKGSIHLRSTVFRESTEVKMQRLMKPIVQSVLCVALVAAPALAIAQAVGSSRVDLQACKLEYSIVSPK